MLNEKQKKLLDKSKATMCQELSFENWVELNTGNKSPRLMDDINEYLKEEHVPENASDLRHLRKTGRAKEIY